MGRSRCTVGVCEAAAGGDRIKDFGFLNRNIVEFKKI
jgi:hypothetical protein